MVPTRFVLVVDKPLNKHVALYNLFVMKLQWKLTEVVLDFWSSRNGFESTHTWRSDPMNMSSMILFPFLNPKYDIFGRLRRLMNCKLEHSIYPQSSVKFSPCSSYLATQAPYYSFYVTWFFFNYIFLLIDVSSQISHLVTCSYYCASHVSLTLLIVSCDLGLDEGVAIVQDFKLLTLLLRAR